MVPVAVGSQGHGATAAKGARDGALGRGGQPGGRVGELGQRCGQLGVRGADFQAQGALSGSGQHHLGLDHLTDAAGQAQALEAGGGQHDGVVLAFVEFAQAGVEVAAQGLDAQVGAQGAQLGEPAQAGGAHHRALRQGFERVETRADERVTRVLALEHGGQHEAFGQLHGNVLERVHGQVGAASFKGHFEFFDEQALAAHLGQRAVEDLVALGGHAQQVDLAAKAALQQVAHVLGLPKGEAAFTGGDDPGGGGGGSGRHPPMLSATRARPVSRPARCGASASG